MALICPTVTAESEAQFNAQLSLISGFANRIHIDSMDGDFAPTYCPVPDTLTLPNDVIVDIHVMYRNPAQVTDRLIALAPNLVVVHAESAMDIPYFAAQMREHGIKTGLALLPETSVASVEYVLPHVQHVLIFGGHLGYHGGQADLSQLDKVAEVRLHNKNLEIAWDGGANENTIAQLIAAGIDVINVGSAIHTSSNPEAAYLGLMELSGQV